MYEFIHGTLTHRSPTAAVVDVGGMGYRLEVSLRTSGRLPEPPAAVKLLVHHRVQEDRARLFGFIDEAERTLFRRLVSVAGIGPSHGLALLSGYEPDEVWRFIAAGDWKALARSRGIGPKIAQRVCTELAPEAGRQALPASAVTPAGARRGDAVAALMVLGFTDSQAEKAVEAAAEEVGAAGALEDLVRAALRRA